MKEFFLSILIFLLAMSVIGCAYSPSPGALESSSSTPSEETSSAEIEEGTVDAWVRDTWLNEMRYVIDVDNPESYPWPDEIIYYHDGKRTVFPKGDDVSNVPEEYEKIFQLNQARLQGENVHGVVQWIPLDHTWRYLMTEGKLLEYKSSGSYSLFFSLTTLPYDDGENFYFVTTQNGSTFPTYKVEGGEPTELLKYLESVVQ